MKEYFVPTPVFSENLPFSIMLAGESYCDGSYKIFRKCSDITCIESIISGKGTVNIKNKTYHPKAGDTYILLAGEDHSYYSNDKDGWVKIWINVKGNLVKSLIDAYSIGNQVVFNCNTEGYLREIHAILEDKSLSATEISEKTAIVFHALLQTLSKSVRKTHNANPDAQAVKNYIDAHIYENITIDDLAALVYKSTAHTIRVFKNEYGVTPYDYYLANKIKKAIYLLSDTQYSVKEIAYKLGFCDEHYFSNLIKAKTGKKPTDYR